MRDEGPVRFTPEEEQEFTLFNAAAFDEERKRARTAGKTPLCWLATPREDREAIRLALFRQIRAKTPSLMLVSDERVEALVNSVTGMDHVLVVWIGAELKHKQLRAAGSPLAFFAVDAVR